MNMKYMEMLKGARNIVGTCANVRQGENVLIVTDTKRILPGESLLLTEALLFWGW